MSLDYFSATFANQRGNGSEAAIEVREWHWKDKPICRPAMQSARFDLLKSVLTNQTRLLLNRNPLLLNHSLRKGKNEQHLANFRLAEFRAPAKITAYKMPENQNQIISGQKLITAGSIETNSDAERLKASLDYRRRSECSPTETSEELGTAERRPRHGLVYDAPLGLKF